MAKFRPQKTKVALSIPGRLTADLKGKQSVRATFRLTEKTINAVNVVATHLGIKQKSLFDHLIDDIKELHSLVDKTVSLKPGPKKRIQKTYVISRKSLEYLEEYSKNYETPRDALVEYSVQRLLPIIAREQEKHERRKVVLEDLKKHIEQGRKILEKTRQELGEDDPVSEKIRSAVAGYEVHYRFIEAFIEKSKIIEEF